MGGAVSALAFWLLLTPLRTLTPAAAPRVGVVVVAFLAVGAELGWLHERQRIDRGQVPPEWLGRLGPTKAYLAYGLSLGSGVATHVEYTGTYTVFSAIGLLAPFPVALAAGGAFGLARTWVVGPIGGSRVGTGTFVRLFDRRGRVLPLASAGLSIALVGVVLWTS